MRRLIGEFRPPREVVAMGVARVVGRGALSVGPAGLEVEARVTRAPRIPATALGAAGLLLLVVGAAVPGTDRVVIPLLLAGTAAAVYGGWRAEYGTHGRFTVPWDRVEHVVRLPADPEVLGVVLSGPLAGDGSPEQLYFAASNGAEVMIEALREAAPGVSTDLDSALRDRGPEPEGD